jgi:hypothetical protein
LDRFFASSTCVCLDFPSKLFTNFFPNYVNSFASAFVHVKYIFNSVFPLYLGHYIIIWW